MSENSRSSRRRFLKGASLAGVGTALGMRVPFAANLQPGVSLLDVVESDAQGAAPQDKKGIRVLNDRPFNAETPVTLLDDEFTPNNRFFVRNNGLIPERAKKRDLTGWSLAIDGEVERPANLSLEALKKFPNVERALVIECGGNGRAGYQPPARGNQWTLGAVGCAKYRGVRLRDVLRECGLKKSAVYTGYYGEDTHLSGDPKKSPISRGVPIAKAMDEHTLLVWEMNGEPLPSQHGFPLRLVCPGWPGSTSGKWLRRIWIRDQQHDGTKMTGTAYRLPRYPVAPGTKVPDSDMVIIEEMPVKSILTRPGSGIEHPKGQKLAVRGHAWSGHGDVKQMDVSIDFGQTWIECKLQVPANKYAWQRWTVDLEFPTQGYYEVWARATDATGRRQPMVVPGWNPKGYCNNAMQRIAVKVI
jgi:DMSO/TMAO reductase YedYZ molybdopterin-dependent catalytic subunit